MEGSSIESGVVNQTDESVKENIEDQSVKIPSKRAMELDTEQESKKSKSDGFDNGTENGNGAKEEDDEVVEVAVPDVKPEMIVLDDINDDEVIGPDEVPTAEEKGFWTAVEENPNDFASWTYLLQVVEKNGKLKQIQKAFTKFLTLYPYCYGYWKKYADQTKKLVSNEAAYQVYNDAVVAIPLSVDLWTYFIHFIAEWKEGDEKEIRTIYQRAVAACGRDFRSDKIWEAFVEWEKQTDQYKVLKLYKQFLGCIIQRHQYHFDKFREWIFFTPVKDMVTMEDIRELLTRHKADSERRRIETEQKIKEEEERAREAQEEEKRKAAEAEGLPTADDPADVEMEEETPEETKEEPVADKEEEPAEEEEKKPTEEEEEEEEVPKVEDITEVCVSEFHKVDMEEPLPDSPEALTAKQEAAIREQMLLDMAPVHERILGEIEEIVGFEEGIKRPYFHVKELERVQLKNWKNYLNLVIGKGDNSRTTILFERCLIACAFYEGFWVKYINFMSKLDKEETSKIYRRACTIHLVKKPQIHLNWAAFEEQRGRLEEAREALDHIEGGMPGLIAIKLRRAGIERRCGNIQQGGDILKKAIEDTRDTETHGFWVLKYVNYLQYLLQDFDAAKQYLEEEIERSSKDRKLFIKLLEMESAPKNTELNISVILSTFERIFTSELSIEDKAGFSYRRLTFLEEYNSEIDTIVSAYEEHNKNWRAVLDDKKKEVQTKEAKKAAPETPPTATITNNTYNSFNRSSTTQQPASKGPGGYGTRDSRGGYGAGQGGYNQNSYSNHSGYGYGNASQQQQQYQQWYSQYQQYSGQYQNQSQSRY